MRTFKNFCEKLAFTALFIAFFPLAALSQEGSLKIFKEDKPVNVTADSLNYDNAAQTYHASGNVEAVQDKIVLRADEMVFDMVNNTGAARGHLSGTDEGGNEMSGESLTMDIKEETVVIFKARLFFKRENVYLSGDVMKKTGEETYESDKLTYTPCDCPEGQRPAWSFYASHANIERGQYMTGRHAFFQIKDVPVLYTPYFTVPIKNERQTGFLTPKPGYSRLRGFVIENAFFWDIAKNEDATFYLDVETQRGLGKGVEYRYIRKRSSFGEFNFYQYKEKNIERVREFRKNFANLARPMTASNDRWQLKYNHNEYLPGGFVIKANINVVSDDEYFIDFAKTGKDRSLGSLESNVSLSRSWSAYSFVTQLRYFDNLLVQDKSTILQKLPEMNFKGADQSVASTPFYISFESSFINFNRDTGVRGQRLDAHPRLSLPVNASGYFDFTPSIAPRATLYEVNGDPQGGGYNERYVYDVKADLTTTFVRIFETDSGAPGAVKHTIRPKIEYTYLPEMIQDDQPVFDSVDHLPAASALTYSLNNTLTGKFMRNGNRSYLDFLYMDISQTYDINEATRRLHAVSAPRRPFSDVSAELILKPAAGLKVSGKEKFNTYDKTPTSYDASVEWTGSGGNRVSLTERFLRAQTRYIEAYVNYRAARAVNMSYAQRYSDDLKKSLETVYGLEYKPQCWSVNATYTVKPEEKSIFFTFNLMGLGKVAAVKGMLE
ncbi:MAG: LPS-assembly protein LptD [Deltaproteobacteria bacterium]|nr:LPS-assembly protein LptD [Deltaproteobacteria bacterium]